MNKSQDNGVNHFSNSPKKSKTLHQYDEFKKYENIPLFEHNSRENYIFNYEVLKSNISYPVIEDNINSNKNTLDSNISEAISESSKEDFNICQFIGIPKLINLDSIVDNLFILEGKDDKNERSSVIPNEKNNAKKRDIFRVVYPSFFKIFHPGSNEKYPRELINLILKNKIKISLSIRGRIKKKRKFYSDNIRRKIKCTFHNSLKNTLNKRLKYSDSKFFFDYLPQNFITNVTKDLNKQILNMSFTQFFSKDFSEIEGKDKDKKKNLERSQINILAIEYIEENDGVREKSNYNYYKNMKYYEIYDEYLRSKEFEEDIIKIEKINGKEYIKQYINLALHLMDYFF